MKAKSWRLISESLQLRIWDVEVTKLQKSKQMEKNTRYWGFWGNFSPKLEFSRKHRKRNMSRKMLSRCPKWRHNSQEYFIKHLWTHLKQCGAHGTKKAKKSIFVGKTSENQHFLAYFSQKLEISSFQRNWNICRKMLWRCSKWRQHSQDHFMTPLYVNRKHSGGCRIKKTKKNLKMAYERRLNSVSNFASLFDKLRVVILIEGNA